MKNLSIAVSLVFVLCTFISTTQVNIQFVSEVAYPTFTIPIFNIDGGNSALTPLIDRQNRPYLYVASNELGLHIYETDPVLNLVATLDTAMLTSVVSSLDQSGDILVLGLGSNFGDTVGPMKVATVDISNPASPQILDIWLDPAPTPNMASGIGSVRIAGDFCYLGGMGEGLVVIDISDPNAIGFVSKIKPDISWPHATNTLQNVNARGMALMDSLVYLCYDAGGMRTINIADPYNPMEVDSFANPITFVPSNWPRAYNHVVIEDTIAYIAVDYCGVEIWGLGNPLAPVLLHHWNPVGCPGGGLIWFGAPIHTNELKIVPECNWLFVATASSELSVLDVADPYNPVEIDSFGTVMDTTGTWGLDVNHDRIYLTYVNVPDYPIIPEPFHGNWGGVKQLSYEHCNTGVLEVGEDHAIQVYPNPVSAACSIDATGSYFSYYLTDPSGKEWTQGEGVDHVEFSTDQLGKGFYFLHIHSGGTVYTTKLVKVD